MVVSYRIGQRVSRRDTKDLIILTGTTEEKSK